MAKLSDAQTPVALGRAVDRLRDTLAVRDDSEPTSVVLGGVELVVPSWVAGHLVDVLDAAADQRDVTVAPADLTVGTAEAAKVLGVSRPWVARLIDRGDLPGVRVGSKRRVRLGDLMTHKLAVVARQRAAVDALDAVVDQDDAPNGAGRRA